MKGEDIHNSTNPKELFAQIKNPTSSKKSMKYNDHNLDFYCAKDGTEFYDLVFTSVDFSVYDFDFLVNSINNKEGLEFECFKNIIDNSYPSIDFKEKEKTLPYIHIKSSSNDKLKINFLQDRIKEEIFISVFSIIEQIYLKIKWDEDKLFQDVFKVLNEKLDIQIYEGINCIYRDKNNWSITLHGDKYLTLRSLENKKLTLNFEGFYAENSINQFITYINKLMKIEINQKDINLTNNMFYEINLENDIKVRYRSTDLFYFIFKLDNRDNTCTIQEIKDIIDTIISDQKLRLGAINKISTETADSIKIGIINEFGLPADIIEHELKNLLTVFGYNDSQIKIESNITSLDNSKNNKTIYISCGLEHDFASVTNNKLVKDYKKRIKGTDTVDENDYKKLNEYLNSKEIINLQDTINKIYHKADFFITYESDKNIKLSKYKIRQQLNRFLCLLHGQPFLTPTKDEFMMHMAFSSALRSADLSRQVGAVIATKKGDIIATGVNEVSKVGGGSYWAHVDIKTGQIFDDALGRDYIRGVDSNVMERAEIIKNISENLSGYIPHDKNIIENQLTNSQLKDLTEYGRVVHAEMEALMACARNQVSTLGTTLYGTTFPCHNCAKHIIAAGIDRVVYLEPYSKSKAFTFHVDSIVDEEENLELVELQTLRKKWQNNKDSNSNDNSKTKILFEKFVGVGPKRFKELFEMKKNSRKIDDGNIKGWEAKLLECFIS